MNNVSHVNGMNGVNVMQHEKVRVPASMAATELRTELVKVTPEIAAKWLSQNTASNRNISKRTVEAYAEDMKNDRWSLTHQGIAFNKTGELVDGQHRLHAILLSETVIPMMVTTGLALEYNSPLDQGYNRSFAHILGKSTRWVSVVRGLVMLQNGMSNTGFKNTVGMLEETAEKHGTYIEQVLALTTSSRSCPTGLVSALVFAYPVDISRISSFCREINTGELIQKGDPALALRRWVGEGRHTSRETILATVGAIKYVLQKKPLMKITAGVNGEKDGYSNYAWLVRRRRAMKIFEGTPSVDILHMSKDGISTEIRVDNEGVKVIFHYDYVSKYPKDLADTIPPNAKIIYRDTDSVFFTLEENAKYGK